MGEAKLFYTEEDIDPRLFNERPGEPPFTRGIYKDMYRGKLWTMRQYAGFGSPEETGRRFGYLLEKGQTGLSLAFDLPTQLGYDADDPSASGEIGKTGVAISTLEDLEWVFKDIPMDTISVSMTINATAPILLAMYIVLAKKRGIPLSSLSGTIQNDILKEFVARGNYIYPIEVSVKLALDLVEFCTKFLPKWNPISMSGYHYREAGCDALQELTFTFADAITYIEKAQERGIPLAQFLGRISFFFSVANDFFEEIAKLRAARRIWAHLVKERFKINDPNLVRLRFHIQTAGSTLVANEPKNNLIRVTLQALASVLGGTQSLHTNSYDEAISLPSEEAVELALRTQQIIAYESGVARVVDPLGGSYFIENLTSRIETEVFKLLKKIDTLGGAIKAIESRFFQHEIEANAYRYQQEIEHKKRIVIGLNQFNAGKKYPPKGFTLNPTLENMARERVTHYKKNRDINKVTRVLNELKKQAEQGKNLMDSIISAVEQRATLGEISKILKEVFGTYKK